MRFTLQSKACSHFQSTVLFIWKSVTFCPSKPLFLYLQFFRAPCFESLAQLKISVFREVALWGQVDVDRRSGSAYCLHHQGDEWLIALMMEAVRTCETSGNINFTTRRYFPEDSNLHTRCRENLKSHISTVALYSLHLGIGPQPGGCLRAFVGFLRESKKLMQ
jgi:hypothetical protein